MENNSELTCFNCKYFVQYYIKFRQKFRKVEYGHCINDGIKKREKLKNIKKINSCTFWKPIERTNENDEIEINMLETAEKLRQIARYLQSD